MRLTSRLGGSLRVEYPISEIKPFSSTAAAAVMARKKPAARAAALVRQYGPNHFAESVPVRQTLRNDAYLHIASTTIPTPGTFIIHLRKATKRYEPYSVVVDKEGYFLLFHDTAEGRWQLDRCRRELGGARLENHVISFDPLKETTAECAVHNDVLQTDNVSTVFVNCKPC